MILVVQNVVYYVNKMWWMVSTPTWSTALKPTVNSNGIKCIVCIVGQNMRFEDSMATEYNEVFSDNQPFEHGDHVQCFSPDDGGGDRQHWIWTTYSYPGILCDSIATVSSDRLPSFVLFVMVPIVFVSGSTSIVTQRTWSQRRSTWLHDNCCWGVGGT
jgi:hypothetical protein